MGPEHDVSFIFPFSGSVHRCRPFLRRVPRTGSPTSQVVLRHSDSPPLVLASLRFLVRRYPGPDRSRPPKKQRGLPGSWGSLLRTCPGLGPRWDLRAGPLRPFALQHVDVAFRCCNGVGSHDDISGLYLTAYTLRCLRFVARVDLWTTQDSLPAGGQPWPGGRREAHVPLGSIVKFQLSSWLPPHPDFSWRTATACSAALAALWLHMRSAGARASS